MKAAAIRQAPEGPVVAGAVLGLLGAAEVTVRSGDGTQLPLALLLGLAATVPVALLRVQPAAAAVVVTAANTLLLGWPGGPAVAGVAAQLVLLHRLGRRGPGAVGPLLALLLALPFAVYAIGDPGTAAGGRLDDGERLLAVAVAVMSAAAAGAGLARRERSRAAAQSATERAIADTLYEHAARGERARIARELHDVVAHHISMISVQAETARLITPGLPADGAKQLLAIGDTARTALTEMRRLLGVLREDAGGESAERRPQPGLAQLNELLDDARDAAGAGVRLIVSGPVRALDPGIELTAYRIVQEALTNARRHAPGSAVDVELHYCGTTLRLRVRDNGPGPAAHPAPAPDRGPGGHGVLGMRERATALGGTLSTGPAPGGGYLVEVTLPAATRTGAAA